MVALPVSRAEIALKEADGVDEMLLHEAAGGPIQAGLELLARLYGEAVDAPGLTVTDFEYLLLRLRAARLGENMSLGFACPHCREPAEVIFKIADYLADVRPRPARGVSPDTAKPGWFRLGETRDFAFPPSTTKPPPRMTRVRRTVSPSFAWMSLPVGGRIAAGSSGRWKPWPRRCHARSPASARLAARGCGPKSPSRLW